MSIVTAERKVFFQENGYVIIPEAFSAREIEFLKSSVADLKTGELVQKAGGKNVLGMAVEDGNAPRLHFDVHRTETPLALVCRHPRLAGAVQELMEKAVYIYHSKLAFKAAFVGSVQYWHQDYSYWVDSGNPTPEMASALIMLDEHTEGNACMQVLAGSQRGGLVPHEHNVRGSTGDDQLCVPAEAMANYCHSYQRAKLVGQPGTVAVWHANTMHASGHNISENSRNALIVAFNTVGNRDANLKHDKDDPYGSDINEPLELVADTCLL